MMELQVSDRQLGFQLPCRVTIAAPSGSGKTHLFLRIIENRRRLFSHQPACIWYCYPQDTEHSAKDVQFRQRLERAAPGIVRFSRGLPPVEELKYMPGHKVIMINVDRVDRFKI
jgi:hypothetical protein